MVRVIRLEPLQSNTPHSTPLLPYSLRLSLYISSWSAPISCQLASIDVATVGHFPKSNTEELSPPTQLAAPNGLTLNDERVDPTANNNPDIL